MELESEIEQYFDRLFPLNRSITGAGYQKSLEIIQELMPLQRLDFFSGQKCLDWIIPDEWNIRDAYIECPDGKRIANLKDHNLHVVGYSEPIDKQLELEELRPHLYTMEDLPDAIPYVTSYYKRNWGFCIPFEKYKQLKSGLYRVYIDSSLKPGQLTVGMTTIPGKTDNEILISTYLCHPSMAVNELSGPLVTAFLYKTLNSMPPLNHTVRFVVCPENIGAAAFLSVYGDHLKEKLSAGYVVNCVGHGNQYTYKRSRRHSSLADRAALNTLTHQTRKFEVIDFFAGGSDERQYCSPGFNLPLGLIMRTMYGRYPEYHSSADDKTLIEFSAMAECVDIYRETIEAIDENGYYLSRVQKGTPQFSRNNDSLYPETMTVNGLTGHDESLQMCLELVNLSDGTNDLLSIAEMRNFRMTDLVRVKNHLIQAGYLTKAPSPASSTDD
jgi:aminopeptidase-like protein